MDGAEKVVTTILKFFVALTAGFSAIINTSINIFIAVLHIGVAAFKLHAISKLKTDIEVYYNEKIEGMSVEFEAFKVKLHNLECNHLITVAKEILDREIRRMEIKFTATKLEMKEGLKIKSLTDESQIKKHI